MERNPAIKKISIYPVKSLDGISLTSAKIGEGGCIEHDREYAIIDGKGKFVNGKSNALLHSLRSVVDIENNLISFRHETEIDWQQFHLAKDKEAIDKYLSTFFRIPVTLERNTKGEFLDIPVISGVTVLSTASLQTVGSWFNDMPLEESRKRFRATIEIEHVPAFWEDRLFYEQETVIEFKVGNVMLYGMKPRARCVVPTRHPQTGEVLYGFAKKFAQQRIATLPEWSLLEDYGHGYYLSVDCFIPPSEFGKWIHIGDELSITGKKVIV